MQRLLENYLIDEEIDDIGDQIRVKRIENLKSIVKNNIKKMKKKKKNLKTKLLKEKICKIFDDKLQINPNEDSFIEDDLFFFKKFNEYENKSNRLIKFEDRFLYQLEQKKYKKAIKKKQIEKKNLRNPFLLSVDDYLDAK